ncbi:unnamed protein product [Mytilus edulis]|uniref:C2H2-type domain-containing protein n=1 Tax=Mytilus edulis TaxID=6550 RepID=A0A8S3RIT0_MYTED|nr:unnamed protein product [Mytilus edulis]
MTQAFVNYTLSKGDVQLQNQIHQLRNKNEADFSECDENLLLEAANKIELSFIENTRKRKLNQRENTERKKLKAENVFTCDLCDKIYKNEKQLNRHLHTHFSTYKCDNCGKILSPNVRDDVDKELNMQRKKHRNIKWYVNVRVEMVRDIDDGNQEKAHPHFRSKSFISLMEEDNDHNLNEAFQSINRAMEQFINKGSNWILNKVIFLEVHTVV